MFLYRLKSWLEHTLDTQSVKTVKAVVVFVSACAESCRWRAENEGHRASTRLILLYRYTYRYTECSKIRYKIREITLHEKKLQYQYIFTNFLQSGPEITDFVVYTRAHSDRPNKETLYRLHQSHNPTYTSLDILKLFNLLKVKNWYIMMRNALFASFF